MSQDHTGSGPEARPPGAVLQEIDPDLNIFALANGLDLYRDPEGVPARVLEWYREGMERRLLLTPATGSAGGGLDLALAAEARVEDGRRELTRPFRDGVAPGQLRTVLPKAVEACNALTRDEVEREGAPRGPR